MNTLGFPNQSYPRTNQKKNWHQENKQINRKNKVQIEESDSFVKKRTIDMHENTKLQTIFFKDDFRSKKIVNVIFCLFIHSTTLTVKFV